MFKKFTLWSTLFGIFICLFNYLGYDDKNILLYFLSPPSWLLVEDVSFRLLNDTSKYSIWYSTTIIFGIVFGLLIDFIIIKIKKKTAEQIWERNTRIIRNVVLTIIAVCTIITLQYLRPTIDRNNAIITAANYLGYQKNEKIEVLTSVLNDDILRVLIGKRYWYINIKDDWIVIDAFRGKVLKKDKNIVLY